MQESKQSIFVNDITKSAHWAEHSKRSMKMFGESGVEILHYLSCSN